MKMPREEEFRCRYGGALGVAVYREWEEKRHLFGGAPFTLDFALAAARRTGDSQYTAGSTLTPVIKRMIADGVLEAELLKGRSHIIVRGWNLAKMARHPAFRPEVGDYGIRQGGSKRGAYTVTSVSSAAVCLRSDSGRALAWTRVKWCAWAKPADFSMPAPEMTAADVPATVEKTKRKKAPKTKAAPKTKRPAARRRA